MRTSYKPFPIFMCIHLEIFFLSIVLPFFLSWFEMMVIGMDFWWIDWQQGGTGGGCTGLKQNPTIWSLHHFTLAMPVTLNLPRYTILQNPTIWYMHVLSFFQ